MSAFFHKILNQRSPYVPSVQVVLVVSLFLLLMTSLLMIGSASVPFAMSKGLPLMNFFWSQASYVAIGVVAGWLVYHVPLKWYFKFTMQVFLWLVTLFLLALTLMFGQSINGSQRWLDLGVFNFQVAELAKLVMVLIISDYVVRRSAEIRGNLLTAMRLIVWYLPIFSLLLAQPDYGSVALIVATAFVVLFVSGAPFKHYVALLAIVVPMLVWTALTSDYRKTRIFSFWDPFDDTQNTDYQLARSLIAFGRGEFNGVGYGDSVQKLAHLPEAHTDFLLAITGEELGFLGVAFVLILEFLVIASIMKISHTALRHRQLRLSYMVFGFGVVMFGQVCINAGMNMGLMPTKGLTLPFFSFGGSSLLVMMMMVGIALRVHKDGDVIYERNDNRHY